MPCLLLPMTRDRDSTTGGCRLLPSVYQVARELKKERNSLYNCICSILDDAVFVEELRSLYPGVPVLANLRCGLWYTQQPDDTCYFKSTDGHMGNWSFSTVRLNLHVLQHCIRAGAVMIVDATRNAYKGGFPDALTKTIPIWAAVINRAIAQLRQQQHNGSTQEAAHIRPCKVPQALLHNGQTRHTSSCTTETGTDSRSCTGTPHWDIGVHLPLWISSNEVKQVEARLDGWVAQLLATNLIQLQDMARALKKPLRPLWLSQHSRIWVDQVAQPDELPFTPLYLLTASQPVMHQRRPCPLRSNPSVEQLGQVALARHSTAQEPGLGDHDMQDEEREQQVWTYVYVPGAGDDEESWATGLTPTLLWQNQQVLVEVGPAGVHDLVQQLVSTATTQARQQSSSKTTQATAALHQHRSRVQVPVATDEHHLSPLGVRDRSSKDMHVQHVGGGAYAIHGTTLLLGDRAAGAPPEVWDRADAVLYCGQFPYPAFQEQTVSPPAQQQQPLQGLSPPHEQQQFDWKQKQHSEQGQQQQQQWVVVNHCISETQGCAGHEQCNGDSSQCEYQFAVAAACELGLPPPLRPQQTIPANEKLCPSHTNDSTVHPNKPLPGAADKHKQGSLPARRLALQHSSATAFGAPDVQSLEPPSQLSGPPLEQAVQHLSRCNVVSSLELLSVASLNATGIPATDKCPYQAAGQQELLTMCNGAACAVGSTSTLQVRRSTSSSGGTAAGCSPPGSPSRTAGIPAGMSNCAPTFEFMPSSVVDLAPADYISVPLQLDSRERAELRAALREHQEAVDAAAAAAACAACNCRQLAQHHHLCRRTSLLTSALQGSQTGPKVQQPQQAVGRRQPEQCQYDPQGQPEQQQWDTSPDPAVAHWTSLPARSKHASPGSPFAQASGMFSMLPADLHGPRSLSECAGPRPVVLANSVDDGSMQPPVLDLRLQAAAQPVSVQVHPTDSTACSTGSTGNPSVCLWLPVAGAKQRGAASDQTLQQQLEPALTFVLHHLRAGRRVLIHDDDGLDQCVCVAVAVLLALQRTGASGVEPVSKADVRHTLAKLATSYPQARPTRGLLKQVFAYFHQQQPFIPE